MKVNVVIIKPASSQSNQINAIRIQIFPSTRTYRIITNTGNNKGKKDNSEDYYNS